MSSTLSSPGSNLIGLIERRLSGWSHEETSAKKLLRFTYGLLFLVVGGMMTWWGMDLLVLGGSYYYFLSGLLVIFTALAILRALWRLAASIYLALMMGTFVWSLAEAGLNGWALMPRLLSPAVLGLPLFIVALVRGSWKSRLVCVGLALTASIVILAVILSPGFTPRTPDSHPILLTSSGTGVDSPYYGGDSGGSRFSQLRQINPGNVDHLKIAWTASIKSDHLAPLTRNQSRPLKIGDALYTCTPFNDILRLDPETGHIVWRFQSHTNSNVFQAKCRGVAFYQVPNATGPCSNRLFTATIDAQLIAIDADTGKLCRSFGRNGRVNLLEGIVQRTWNVYFVTSAPVAVRGNVVVNSGVADNLYVGEPSGVVRGFDAVTGKLSWAWDVGRSDGEDATKAGKLYTAGTPNSWAPMSADEQLGLVYIPTGNATPDYWGGHRSPASNKYASSVVALDGESGRVRWSFQTTHYDVWDYDVASQPVLFDLKTKGGSVPALAQGTKRGQLFILDRRSGKPLFPVVEKHFPQSGSVERMAPTQPVSVAFPDFAGPRLTESSMWGITALDQLWCRIKFRSARYEGQLTPPGLTYSIVHPGYSGGMNQGSVSIDAARQLALFPSNRVVNYVRLLPRSDPAARILKPDPFVNRGFSGAQLGAPYAVDLTPFLSPLKVPCQAPPYGLLNAVDLQTGKMLWSRPIGSARDLGPLGVPSRLPWTIGTPTTGGALTTASGLTFIAATRDHAFRAYNTLTGKLLFTANLPGSSESSPVTYWSKKTGRQFVIISSEAEERNGRHYGALTAFAL